MPVLILMRRPSGLKPISLSADPSEAAGGFFARFPRFDGLAILHLSSSIAICTRQGPSGKAQSPPSKKINRAGHLATDLRVLIHFMIPKIAC